MKIQFTNNEGTLNFTSVDQAAQYMAYFKRAKNETSAKKNILDVMSGKGSGGDHKGSSKIYNRETAYGYTIKEVKPAPKKPKTK